MRKHEMEIEIAAPPSEVWRAVSTAEGIASWFCPISAVTPGAGGSVTIGWGEGMEATSRIEIWEPDKHLRVVSDRPEPAPPGVIDYLIEGRGGTTVMRLVHSGFGEGADFDGEYEGTGAGWPLFLAMMKHSTERGIDSCRNVTIMRMLSDTPAAAWEKLLAQAGDEIQGGVERIRTKGGNRCLEFPGGAMAGLFCDACGGAAIVTIMWLLYGVTAEEAERVREKWTAVLNRAFGQPAAA